MSAGERADRAKSLLILILLSTNLGDDRLHQGLSIERIAEVISNMLTHGVAK